MGWTCLSPLLSLRISLNAMRVRIFQICLKWTMHRFKTNRRHSVHQKWNSSQYQIRGQRWVSALIIRSQIEYRKSTKLIIAIREAKLPLKKQIVIITTTKIKSRSASIRTGFRSTRKWARLSIKAIPPQICQTRPLVYFRNRQLPRAQATNFRIKTTRNSSSTWVRRQRLLLSKRKMLIQNSS